MGAGLWNDVRRMSNDESVKPAGAAAGGGACVDFGLHSPFSIRHSSSVPATLASLRIRNLALVEELDVAARARLHRR